MLSLLFASGEQGGKSDKIKLLWVLVYHTWVCVFLSGCVCWDNGIIEVLESQAP